MVPKIWVVKFEQSKKRTKTDVFSIVQIWRLVFLEPLGVQRRYVPHFKGLISGKVELEAQGRDSTFTICHTLLKKAILEGKTPKGRFKLQGSVYSTSRNYRAVVFEIHAHSCCIFIIFGQSFKRLAVIQEIKLKIVKYSVEWKLALVTLVFKNIMQIMMTYSTEI